jgi:hypothetical protein
MAARTARRSEPPRRASGGPRAPPPPPSTLGRGRDGCSVRVRRPTHRAHTCAAYADMRTTVFRCESHDDRSALDHRRALGSSVRCRTIRSSSSPYPPLARITAPPHAAGLDRRVAARSCADAPTRRTALRPLRPPARTHAQQRRCGGGRWR